MAQKMGYATNDNAGMFEKLSSSSLELQGMLGDDDLAKDMGIFSYDSRRKNDELQTRIRKSSLDEFDLENSRAKLKSVLTCSQNNNNLAGIFKSSPIGNKHRTDLKRSSSGDKMLKSPPLSANHESGCKSPKSNDNNNLEMPSI